MACSFFQLALAAVVLMLPVAAGSESRPVSMGLRSPAFLQGAPIPARYTCDAEDVSPALSWEGVPPRTRSFALLLEDPDAPAGSWSHWLVYDLPADTRELAEGISAHALKDGVRQGRNSWGRSEYGGPCPPSGTHRYFFRLYALDIRLGLPPGVGRKQLLAAMQGHILARAELLGTYSRQAPR